MLLSKNNFKDHEKAGVTRLSTWAKWGGIWTDARVCLHYWVVIWFAGYFNSPYIAQFMGCVISRIHYGLRSYSASDILLPTIIIIIQECSQALKICKCLWSLSCGGVSNKLLVLSITFHFHYYIWGCMCSIGSLQFRWLRGYIHSSYYYHHPIGSINLTRYHICPWLCAWDACYIIFCHLLYIYSGKIGNVFSLLLCSLWWVQIVG